MKNQSLTILAALTLFSLAACSSTVEKTEKTEKKVEAPAATPTQAPAPVAIPTLEKTLLPVESTPTTKPAPKPSIVGVDPATSLRWLKNGNTRFSKGWLRKDGQTMKDIQRIVGAHRPHAVVVASSDARVPPELIFDQKLGEIFTVRTLGPSLSPEVLGSIEYAILHLGTRNIVVLGHSSCGGAKLAFLNMEGTEPGSENLKALVKDIQPRIKSVVDAKTPSKNFVAECWANTTGVAEEIKARSEILRQAVESDQIKIVSSLYDLETGVVEFK